MVKGVGRSKGDMRLLISYSNYLFKTWSVEKQKGTAACTTSTVLKAFVVLNWYTESALLVVNG